LLELDAGIVASCFYDWMKGGELIIIKANHQVFLTMQFVNLIKLTTNIQLILLIKKIVHYKL